MDDIKSPDLLLKRTPVKTHSTVTITQPNMELRRIQCISLSAIAQRKQDVPC